MSEHSTQTLSNATIQPERQPAAAELPLLSPAEQRFLDAITLPEPLKTEEHQRFTQVIEGELALYAHSAYGDLLQKTAAKLEWLWFAKRGDPLPEGVAVNTRGSLALCSLASQYSQEQASVHLGKKLDVAEPRVNLFLPVFMDFIQHNETEIDRASEAVLKEGEMYKLLRAIVVDTPMAEDVPLSVAQRMVREAQIEDDMRRRHGIESNDSLRMHHNAHQEQQRAIYRLDDETERRPQLQQQDGRARLMDFFVQEFNAFNTGQPPITSFTADRSSSLIALCADGTMMRENESLFTTVRFENFFKRLVDTRGTPTVSEKNCGAIYLADFTLRKLASPDNKGIPATDLLEDASIEVARIVTVQHHETLLYLRGVQADIIDTESGTFERQDVYEATVDTSFAAVHSVERLREERHKWVGVVDEGIDLVTNHLITYDSSRPGGYPKAVDQYDVSITLPGRKWTVPQVPGFDLRAVDGHQFYFSRNETDPYNGSAEVQLDAAQVQAVIAWCEDIGYSELAQRLSATTGITLADLTAMVRHTSDYTFNQEYELQTNTAFAPLDFKRAIHHGRLQVQCTGAAAFMEQAVKVALPGCTTRVIEGLVARQDGVIAAAGHAQLLLAYKGEQYIVDATPSADPASGVVSTHGVGSEVLSQQAHAPRGRTLEVAASLPEGVRRGRMANRLAALYKRFRSETPEAKELTLETAPSAPQKPPESQPPVIGNIATQWQAEAQKRRESVVDRTKMLYKAHFNLPVHADDTLLYQKVARLKKDADPLRRALEVVLRSEAGQDVQAEAEAETVYIANVMQADAALLRRIGVPRYDPSLLQGLQKILLAISAKA